MATADDLLIIHFNAARGHRVINLLRTWQDQYHMVCLNEPPDLSIIKSNYPLTYGKNNKKAAIVLLDSTLNHKVIHEEPESVAIHLCDRKVTIVSIYLTPTNDALAARTCEPIKTVLVSYPTRTLILSDVNAKSKRVQTIGRDTPRASLLTNMIDINGWAIVNRMNEYTHQTKRTTDPPPPSVLDWVIVTLDLKESIDHEVLPFGPESDHAPILVTIHPVGHNNSVPARDAKMMIHIPTFLAKVSAVRATLPPDELVRSINLAVNCSLREIGRPRLSKTINKGIEKELKKQKRRLARAHGRAEQLIRERITDLRRIIAKDKRKHQAKEFQKELMAKNSTLYVQKQISKQRNCKERIDSVVDDEQQTISGTGQMADFIMTHLFPAEQNCLDDDTWMATATTDNNPITHHEIAKSIAKQANSSPGIDRINKSVISAWYRKEPAFFLDLFNQWYNGQTIPAPMMTTQLTLIKKDAKAPPTKANIRPIGKPCVITRLYERIILGRIKYALPSQENTEPMQFAHHSSLTLHHALHRLATAKTDKHKFPVYIACDIKGAYNRVHHGPILKFLSSKGVPNNLIQCASNLLKNRPMDIFGHMRYLPIGLPQGAVISPNFFNYAIQEAIEQTNRELPFPVTITAFCDDITIYWSCRYEHLRVDEKINLIIMTLNAQLNKVNLNLSLQKTRIIMPERISCRLPTVMIEGSPVSMVSAHKILGVDFQLPYCERFALYKKRIFTKAIRVVFELKRFLKSPYLSRYKKHVLVSTFIHAIVLTNAFLWYNRSLTILDMNSLLAIDRIAMTFIHNLPPTIPNIVAFALHDGDPLLIKAGYTKQLQLIRMGKHLVPPFLHENAIDLTKAFHPSCDPSVDLVKPLLTMKDMTDQKQSSWRYFTDASMSSPDDPIGTSMVLLDECDQIADIAIAKLHRSQNVFKGEAYAVWMAVEHALAKGHRGDVVIYTDSMSVVTALANGCSTLKIIRTIQTRIKKARVDGIRIAVGWCKAHNRITPNELADCMAKNATRYNVGTTALPVSRPGLIKILRTTIERTKNAFYDEYETTTLFKEFFPSMEHVNKMRSGFNSMTLRIYTGHGPFICDAIKYSVTKNLPPVCRCDKMTLHSILHLLVQCPVVKRCCKDELFESGLAHRLSLSDVRSIKEATELKEIHHFIKLAAAKILDLSERMLNEVDLQQEHKARR